MDAGRDAYEVLQVNPRAHDDVIRAAYRPLAALYHPDRDGSHASQRRMAELNAAYELVRSTDRRQVYDRTRGGRTVPTTGPTAAPTRAESRDPDILDFGRYAGWTLRQLVREDPDYLRWLSRHSSGIRYRSRIEEVLRETQPPSASERMRGK